MARLVREVGAAALFGAGLWIVVSLSPPSAHAQEDRRALVKELLAVTGTRAMTLQMGAVVGDHFFAVMRAANPQIPVEAQGIVKEVVIAVMNERIDDLLDRMIPLYEKHFTSRELAELIRFYRTDIGQKAITTMPVVMQESMPINQAWVRDLNPELERRIGERLRERFRK